MRLHTDPEEYFLRGRSCNEVFSRESTKLLLALLPSRGYQAVGVDGGIYRDDTFMPRIDAAQSRPKVRSLAKAIEIASQCILAMDEDPPECNGYAITSIPFA
jgi:hypothetical protein